MEDVSWVDFDGLLHAKINGHVLRVRKERVPCVGCYPYNKTVLEEYLAGEWRFVHSFFEGEYAVLVPKTQAYAKMLFS